MVFERKQAAEDKENLEPNEVVQSEEPEQEPITVPTPVLDADDDSEVDDWFANDSRSWKGWAQYAAVVIVVLLAALLIGRTVHHHLNSNKTNNKPTPVVARPSTPPAVAAAPSKPAASTPAPVAANTNLPNTGPGNVVAIFLGASFVAASLHFALNLKRQS